MISVLKEPKCPAIVVVLDTSSIDSDEVDANDFLVEKLIDEFPFPLTLLETSSNSTLDMWNGNQVKPKNHIEPVCSNVVIISNQAGKLQSLHRQVKDHYYVDIALIVLTQQGKAQEIDVVIKDVRNENLFGVLERPGRMTEIRFWTVDDVVHSILLKPHQIVQKKNLISFKGKWSGRQLKIAAIDNPPTVIFDKKSSAIGGVEPSLIKLMSQHWGFTYDYIRAPPNEMWGNVVNFENGTMILTGLLGMLGRKEADVVVGNFYLSIKRMMYIDFTAIYKFSYESFLVPAPKPYPKWTALFYPFTLATWVATIVATVMIIIMLRFVARWQQFFSPSRGNDVFSSFQFCSLYVIGNLLNVQVQPQSILSNANRMFLIWWLFGTLILTTGYRSGLISHMTFPFTPPPIDTFQQLVDSPLKKTSFGDFTKNTLLNATSQKERMLGQELIPTFNLTGMFVLLDSGLWAVESDLENLLYMAATMYPTTAAGPKVHLMRETILPSGDAFGLQKDSQLKPYFDKEIQRLIEAGLVDYHRLQFAKKLDKWNPKKTNSLISFSLNSLQGCFLLLIIGVVISTIIFTGEVVFNLLKTWRIKRSSENNSF